MYTVRLYKTNNLFYWNYGERNDWIISTTNFDYINSLVDKLNFLDAELKPYGKEISNDMILSVIIDEALLQDKECNVVFNKENQI